ncbi:Os06g0318650, partial [Oryza sativa Japonica Group]
MGELTVLSFQASSMHEELAKNPDRSKHNQKNSRERDGRRSSGRRPRARGLGLARSWLLRAVAGVGRVSSPPASHASPTPVLSRRASSSRFLG